MFLLCPVGMDAGAASQEHKNTGCGGQRQRRLCWDQAVMGAVLLLQMVDREAAWGFVAEKEALVIYPAILPCTVALEFDPDVPEGALLRARHCYEDLAPRIEDATGAHTCYVIAALPPA